MSSNSFPDGQPDPAGQATNIWLRVDPRHNPLISKKLGLAVGELRKDIEKEGAEIRSNNRLNLNRYGVEMAIIKMWSQRIEEHANKCCDIFCHHWKLLGHQKTSFFVTVVLENYLLPHIEQLGGTAARHADLVYRRGGSVGKSLSSCYQSSAQSVCKKLKEKLNIEAMELNLIATSIKTLETPAHPGERENAAEKLVPVLDSKSVPKTGRPHSKLTETRRQIIRRVAGTGVEGKEYCDALRAAGLRTSIEWQKSENCPKEFPDAYAHSDPIQRKKWRKRISDEKYKATCKQVHSPKLYTRS
jgi:hypothetical protein